ncbi:hypothetical protein chiPu_0023480, partial [Chiloscyllium punctatum]|nr:hypothetical protein [Chiloscyllium punctatum]
VGQADSIWAHTDPVSRQNSSIEGGVQSLLKSLSAATSGTNVTLQEPDHSQPLPPSSFHRFLREQSIPEGSGCPEAWIPNEVRDQKQRAVRKADQKFRLSKAATVEQGLK